MNADLLYQKYEGDTLSYDGIPANAGQCVQWVEYVLTDSQYGYGLQPFWGYAIDWWEHYGGVLGNFDKLTDGTIKKGDIVIFNTLVGSVYGHIDMAMSDGSYNQFTGADSNWAGNKTVHLVNHVGSQYILGVLRLKGGTMAASQDIADETIIRLAYDLGLNRDVTTAELAQRLASKETVEQVLRDVWNSAEHAALLNKTTGVNHDSVLAYINQHLS